MGIAILVSIIFVAGLLGGAANYYMEQANGAGFRKSLLLGLTAAATVPLLLNTMSSSLTDKCLNGEPAAYFVFFGFCTIAAIFSSKFLQSLGDKLLQELNEVKQKQADLAETTDVLVAQNSDPAEAPEPTTAPADGGDSSEFESFKPGGSSKSSGVVLSEEQKVLNLLQTSKFAFRTVEGIAKDTGIDIGTVQSKLLELEILGKVKKTRRARDGAMLWSLR
ncbi:MAG: YEATS-associated helix-containing protein [Saprospiraceae bacterium]